MKYCRRAYTVGTERLDGCGGIIDGCGAFIVSAKSGICHRIIWARIRQDQKQPEIPGVAEKRLLSAG